jgi:tetratricopeptide (TPR) repeat protein
VSAENSRNRRRLAAVAAFGVFWGAFLVTIGFPPLLVLAVLGGIVLVGAIHVEGRRTAAALRPRLRGATGKVSGVDWQRYAAAARLGAWSAARAGSRVASSAGDLAATASKRTAAAGGAAVSAVESVQRRRTAARAARRLNEQAAALRHEGKVEQAVEVGEQALQLARTVGDRRAEALTLNGIGLAQARAGDEVAALDSYETAVALLSELGDRHGAGLVLANLGALHKVQGHEDQAREAWVGALERLEPGSPEHERTAQQLKLAS